MEKIVWLLFLSWAAWKDLKMRQVPVRMLAALGLLGSVIWAGRIWGAGTPGDILENGAVQAAGFLPGIFLLGTSLISGGGVGLGDAVFFLVSAGFFSAGELWALLFGSLMVSSFWGMVLFMKRLWKKEREGKKTIPFLVCVWPVGAWMVWDHLKRGKDVFFLPASMTVEASYVMAMVLLSLAVLIGTAYDRCREYTAVMTVHHHVERLRGQTEEKETELVFSGWSGQVKRDKKRVTGQAEGKGWSKEIVVDIHEPEAFMRKAAAAEEGLGRLGGGDDG